ncbi:MAG: nicotinate (nicotinamide) nucleotide adenylyltransferase [Bradymonadales bacterium]|nr:nicotinate (nicotinamide) nucleotide adenylyltransferase [Bradymonadales bacterium]
MRIALLGGAFDPPHVCHLLAAVWTKSTAGIDRVWFVPTFCHAFGKQMAPYDLRCRMLSLALQPLASFCSISRIEQELGGESRTIDTLTALIQKQPADVFSLVIGSDILLETHKWKQFDRLEQMAEVIVLGRAGYPVDDPRIRFTLPSVSSSEIREHLENGDVDFCRPLVPSRVLAFIDEVGLYRPGSKAVRDPSEEPCQP